MIKQLTAYLNSLIKTSPLVCNLFSIRAFILCGTSLENSVEESSQKKAESSYNFGGLSLDDSSR